MHIPHFAKQILGAVAGATVAMIIYEAYLLIGPSLTALVSMPTAPGVDQQDQVRISNKEVMYDQERRERRQKELAERFGNDAVSATSADYAIVGEESSSSVRAPGFQPLPIGAGVTQEPPVVQPVEDHKEKRLPNSGFGLDLVAVAAVGAVIGRRKMKSL